MEFIPSEIKLELLSLNKNKHFSKLETRARSLLENYQTSEFIWKALIIALQVQGKPYALESAAATISIPDSSELNFLLGQALHAASRIDEALTSFERACDLNTHYLDAYSARVGILMSQKKFEHAELICKKMISIDPHLPSSYNNLGVALRNQGKLDLAKASIQKAIALDAEYAPAHFNLGNLLKVKAEHGAALASYRRTVEIDPSYFAAHYNLGILLGELNQHDEAIQSYRCAIRVNPNYIEAINNLGTTLQQIGKLDEAIENFKTGILIAPNLPKTHNNLGVALMEEGSFELAKTSFLTAIKIDSNYAGAHNNLGNLFLNLCDFESAIQHFEVALQINPNSADAHNNIGNAYKIIGSYALAKSHYESAIKLQPNNWSIRVNLGSAQMDFGYLEEALITLQDAVELSDENPKIINNLAIAHLNSGDLYESENLFKSARKLGFKGSWLRSALMVPQIMGTKQQVTESRARVEHNLELLTQIEIPNYDPLAGMESCNFYLAFQGFNDCSLQKKISNFYLKNCPTLGFTSQHYGERNSSKGEIKIGFLSKFFFQHSVSIGTSSLIENLSKNSKFDAFLISNGPIDRNIFGSFQGKYVGIANSLSSAQNTISALKLDILVYLDIGMDPLSYFLAFSRLADFQCVLGGHPVTTGIPNVDYFLSCEIMEPEIGHEHYSEKLVKLRSPPFYFSRPHSTNIKKTREDFGFPSDWRIYCCPMKLQKIHPDFDAALSEILETDPHARIILIEDNIFSWWRRATEERFDFTIANDVRDRIIFLPWINDRSEFFSLISISDVILDPFHFGIGTTALMTFFAGMPLVTMEGEFLRSRVGTGFCRMMGLPECVESTREGYIKKAIEVARNEDLKHSIQKKIRSNEHVIFENNRASTDLEAFFLGCRKNEN